jgi:hypothetical protein
MRYVFASFHFHIPTRRQCQPGRGAPMHFSPSFFRWAKPMPSRTRSLGFSNSRMSPHRGMGRLQDYTSACPHHGMEEWFIIQSFYHGLIHSA